MTRRFGALALLGLAFCGCGADPAAKVETYTVQRGEFVVSVTETGEIEAVHSNTLTAPMIPWNLGGLKIVRLVQDGEQVEKDQIVVEFDKTEVQKNLDDARAALEIALAEVRKARATQAAEIEELEANLRKSELQHRIAKLELERARFEAEIRRKELELNVQKAAIALQKAREEIENKKKVDREELSKLELKVKQERSKVEEAEETLAKLTLRAPTPGIAILKKNWTTDEKVQVDDEVWRGQPLIGLPDLSRLQANVLVNEVDIAKIDTAQEAVIRLDAFPDTTFRGRVTEVAVLARNKERGSKVKVFDVKVLLVEQDSTMMPGMTVSCEIIVDRLPDTLFVPLDAVFQREGETVVYVKDGGDFRAQPVEIGPENDDYVVIVSGLQEGDVVALSDPTAEPVLLTTDTKRE